MNLRKRQREHAEVSTESLNDIMFFLLLFFLILSTLVSPNVMNLNLPNSKANRSAGQQKITIQVTKDLQYYLGTTQVRFDELEPGIKFKLGDNPVNATVVLKLDQSLKLQDFVDILQIGEKLKVKMILATKASIH
ncbi:MAG TPA: biopolymer transporter ExbD [Bacteroidia bacterium]|jgi:biopolymer transport protein ExbD|nr:biopolymer transporter ExbD [Bacteroidia bacterium]